MTNYNCDGKPYILATDSPDYQDMWYNLYEHVLSHSERHVIALMQEMDPSLIEDSNPVEQSNLKVGGPCPNCGEKEYRIEHQGTTRTIWICDECGYKQTYR
jgi:predicted RNA-binding Zn-ribbon protein involved in translation (DUF1610 family)